MYECWIWKPFLHQITYQGCLVKNITYYILPYVVFYEKMFAYLHRLWLRSPRMKKHLQLKTIYLHISHFYGQDNFHNYVKSSSKQIHKTKEQKMLIRVREWVKSKWIWNNEWKVEIGRGHVKIEKKPFNFVMHVFLYLLLPNTYQINFNILLLLEIKLKI